MLLDHYKTIMQNYYIRIEDMPSLVSRAVVLESGLGLESGLETFSIVSDLSWTRWYLDSDLSRTWSLDSPNVQVGLDRVQQYMLLFFSFKTKTRLFRKWVM